jgi:hypothetical protein
MIGSSERVRTDARGSAVVVAEDCIYPIVSLLVA